MTPQLPYNLSLNCNQDCLAYLIESLPRHIIQPGAKIPKHYIYAIFTLNQDILVIDVILERYEKGIFYHPRNLSYTFQDLQ